MNGARCRRSVCHERLRQGSPSAVAQGGGSSGGHEGAHGFPEEQKTMGGGKERREDTTQARSTGGAGGGGVWLDTRVSRPLLTMIPLLYYCCAVTSPHACKASVGECSDGWEVCVLYIAGITGGGSRARIL